MNNKLIKVRREPLIKMGRRMIVIGIGSNLTSDNYSSSLDACQNSIKLLKKNNIEISSRSSWYETSPIPASNQSNFINGVVSIKTPLDSLSLLKLLLKIELKMGRKRGIKNAARIIDLDLIAYNNEIVENETLILPHPRLSERAFVMKPLAEIAPEWRHPILGIKIDKLINNVSKQKITRIDY